MVETMRTTLDILQGQPPIDLNTYIGDGISQHIQQFKIWEPLETAYIIENVKHGDHVIDLGANIGYFTTILSRIVGKYGSVHAIEPNDSNFALLVENLKLNGCENVFPIKAICADKCGTGTLREFGRGNMGMHEAIPDDIDKSCLLSHGFERLSSHQRITLDSLYDAGLTRVDFIKMDTQGSEYLILKGGERMLRSNKEHLKMVIEFSPQFIELFLKVRPIKVIKLIREFGFSLRFFDRLNGTIPALDNADDENFVSRVNGADGKTWMRGEPFADLICEPLK